MTVSCQNEANVLSKILEMKMSLRGGYFVDSCNSNARSPVPMKVGIMGGDAYINSVLRPYVEHFSAKTPDWQTFIKFLLIPLGE